MQYVTTCTPLPFGLLANGTADAARDPSDLLNDINFGPTEPDFETISKSEIDEKTIEEQDKEAKLTQKLLECPYNYLSSTEKEIYHNLAKLEVLIGWHNLLSICSTIFDLDHVDKSTLNSEITTATEEIWASKNIKLKPFKLIFAEYIKIDRNILKNATNADQQSSNESFSSTPEDYNFGDNFKPSIKEEANEFDKQVLENAVKEIKDQIVPKSKCMKISTLLKVMHHDLLLLQEWIFEQTKTYPMGVAWVMRGDLAYRLCRYEHAESAYLMSLKYGMSLYSLRKLMELYTPKYISPCLKCMSEVYEIAQGRVSKTLKVMPDWIENIFFKLVEKAGMKSVINKLKKNELTDCYFLLNAVEKCKYWRVEGYNR